MSWLARHTLAAASVLLLLSTSEARADDRINAVLGDVSWIARHGHAPSRGDGEAERIGVHLEYVEQLLRQAQPALDAATQSRRSRLLDELASYRRAGRFPLNDRWPTRRPRFIDAQGRLCAVAHLIAVSAGPAMAARIQARHQWDYIADMRDPAIQAWATHNGFSLRELAMIQPQYRRQDPARPTWEQLEEKLRLLLTELETCARKDSPVEVSIEVIWKERYEQPRLVVTTRAHDAALEHCVLERARRLTRRVLQRYAPKPEVRGTLRVVLGRSP